MEDGSLSSLHVVRAAELFPKPEPEKEDESLKTPFTECKPIFLWIFFTDFRGFFTD